jgi:hypothetical protein
LRPADADPKATAHLVPNVTLLPAEESEEGLGELC